MALKVSGSTRSRNSKSSQAQARATLPRGMLARSCEAAPDRGPPRAAALPCRSVVVAVSNLADHRPVGEFHRIGLAGHQTLPQHPIVFRGGNAVGDRKVEALRL